MSGAVYHVSVVTLNASGGGSAQSSVDYIARIGRYRTRRDPVLHLESGHMPMWAQRGRSSTSRSAARAYWRAADRHERDNGRLAKVVVVALPTALSLQDQIVLSREIARAITVGVDEGNLPWTAAIHAGLDSQGRSRNPHVHIMVSERLHDGLERTPALWFRRAAARVEGRTTDPGNGGARKTRALKARSWLHWVRATVAAVVNRALQAAGLSVRVDHRSHAARGLTRPPQPKLGRRASQLERDGLRTRRGDAILAVMRQWTGPGLPRGPTLAPRAETTPPPIPSSSLRPAATQARRVAADPPVQSSSASAPKIAPGMVPSFRIDVAPIPGQGNPIAVRPSDALTQPDGVRQAKSTPRLRVDPDVQSSAGAFGVVIDSTAVPSVETRPMIEPAKMPSSVVSRVVAGPNVLPKLVTELTLNPTGQSAVGLQRPESQLSPPPRIESTQASKTVAQTPTRVSGSLLFPFPVPSPELQRQSTPAPMPRSLSSIRWPRRESVPPQRASSQSSAPRGSMLIVAKVERGGTTQVTHEAYRDAMLDGYPNADGVTRAPLGSHYRLLLLSDGRRVRDFGDRLEVLPGTGPSAPHALARLIAETKRWSMVQLDGPESMRLAARHSLSAAGIHVFGYEPPVEVVARLRQAPIAEHPSPTAAAEWDPASRDYPSESPTP
jgi:MobA/MobL family